MTSRARRRRIELDADFPLGMRIMAVDDDIVCLKLLETLLIHCGYRVTATQHARTALNMLRANTGEYDLVLTDVRMPEMDGFQLLELVGLEMDIPVIMFSMDSGKDTVMKGILHGACDFLLKPLRIEELRTIWKHVLKKSITDAKEVDDQGHDITSVAQGDDHHGVAPLAQCDDPHGVAPLAQADDFHDVTLAGQSEDYSSQMPLRRNQNRGKEMEEDSDSSSSSDDDIIPKKPRIAWSPELHTRFIMAVNQLGLDRAVPKRVLHIMRTPGLSRENVASHLQKYRNALKKNGLGPDGSFRFGQNPPRSIFLQDLYGAKPPAGFGNRFQNCSAATQSGASSHTTSPWAQVSSNNQNCLQQLNAPIGNRFQNHGAATQYGTSSQMTSPWVQVPLNSQNYLQQQNTSILNGFENRSAAIRSGTSSQMTSSWAQVPLNNQNYLKQQSAPFANGLNGFQNRNAATHSGTSSQMTSPWAQVPLNNQNYLRQQNAPMLHGLNGFQNRITATHSGTSSQMTSPRPLVPLNNQKYLQRKNAPISRYDQLRTRQLGFGSDPLAVNFLRPQSEFNRLNYQSSAPSSQGYMGSSFFLPRVNQVSGYVDNSSTTQATGYMENSSINQALGNMENSSINQAPGYMENSSINQATGYLENSFSPCPNQVKGHKNNSSYTPNASKLNAYTENSMANLWASGIESKQNVPDGEQTEDSAGFIVDNPTSQFGNGQEIISATVKEQIPTVQLQEEQRNAGASTSTELGLGMPINNDTVQNYIDDPFQGNFELMQCFTAQSEGMFPSSSKDATDDLNEWLKQF